MDDVLRQRLSPEELEEYDTYDRRASTAAHFVVWPLIAAFILFAAGNGRYSMLCLGIALIAFPIVVLMGRRAGALRVLAEERYAAILGRDPKEELDADDR